MATSSLEVWDDKPNHSACRVRGTRTPPSQDQRRDPSPGPAATRQPGQAADPLRQHRLPLPRRPAAAVRALPDLDPQGRQQDRHPHPGHHPGRRPAPNDGELPATTRTHHRTRDPRAPAGQRRPDPPRPLTGLSARALSKPDTASLPTWPAKVSRPPADLARTPAFASMTWGAFSPSWTPSCLASSNAGTSSATVLRVARGEGGLTRTSWRRLGGLQSAEPVRVAGDPDRYVSGRWSLPEPAAAAIPFTHERSARNELHG